MTNMVPRGAGRATHAAKTAKHAQRTPLPPKTPRKPVDLAAEREVREELFDSIRGGGTKAAVFTAFAKEHGWTVTNIYSPNEDIIEVLVEKQVDKHGNVESIHASWVKGCVKQDNAPVYSQGGRTILLRNISAARQHIDGSKPVPPLSGAPRRSRRTATTTNEDGQQEVVVSGRVPFDVETATDAEVLSAVAGRRIIWRNTISGVVEEAQVPSKSRHAKVEETSAGRRVLSFPAAGTGFRSVALTSLLAVR